MDDARPLAAIVVKVLHHGSCGLEGEGDGMLGVESKAAWVNGRAGREWGAQAQRNTRRHAPEEVGLSVNVCIRYPQEFRINGLDRGPCDAGRCEAKLCTRKRPLAVSAAPMLLILGFMPSWLGRVW